MMRGFTASGILAIVASIAACGLDVVGTPPADGPNTDNDGGPRSELGDAGSSGSAPTEAGADPDAAQKAVVASHTTEPFDEAAPDLSGVTAIDTSALTITGGSSTPRFEDHAGLAVLYVNRWTVDATVRITGSRKLIVLATGPVMVDAVIDAGARGGLPGPGGFGPGAGPGAGGSGVHQNADDSTGGGGAGFGGAGASGASVGGADGGIGGVVYGGSRVDFFGGSGGGKGGDACPTDSGGAGGGAIQITSAISIAVAGGINVGGGGGSGGCSFVASAESAAGGGGGSGGLIFLEAPAIVVDGNLSANGGGGGGGSNYNASVDGAPGADANVGVAAGGTKASTSAGGAGGTGMSAAVTPSSGIVANNGGGGGGGVGRVWLRTRSVAATVNGSSVSPAPTLDTTL